MVVQSSMHFFDLKWCYGSNASSKYTYWKYNPQYSGVGRGSLMGDILVMRALPK
jgi:hypothetical protein